jgi:hypothetical protein
MSPIDFSELAMETMELTKNLNSKVKENSFNLEGPGLFYFIDKGERTFCVRGVVVEDGYQNYKQIENGEFNYEKLGNFDPSKNQLNFFPTKSISLAEIVQKQILNQRFPINEEIIFNLSDPGFSWWMTVDDEGFYIFMRHPGPDMMENIINLGPLGDPKKAKRIFNEIVFKLVNLFPIEEFYCNEISFCLRVKDKKNFFFQALKNLFYQGSMEEEIGEYFGAYLGPQHLNFFNEISAIRGFWLRIKNNLN